MRNVLATAFVLGSAASALAQGRFPLPPEPPAAMPNATTLPTLRGTASPGAEAPAPMPGGTALPSSRGGTLGAEAPAAMPLATTLPSFRDGAAMPQAGPAGSGPVAIPNGNGTSTIIGPDGAVRIVPTPR